MPTTPFEEIIRLSAESGVEKSLDYLDHFFRRNKDFYKLFEVLKMKCRHRLGLALMYSSQPDDLSDDQQKELEDGLLDACREVGTLLIRSGNLQDGWMYLQPLADRNLTEKLIESVPVDENNIDDLIEISVSQGAAPAYGFGLLLRHYGTCNGITTFDTQVARFDRPIQKAMAEKLLHHLYQELMSNVRYGLEQTGGKVDEQATLGEVLELNPEMLSGGAHHIDTTHLASLMRIARVVSDPKDIRMALDLAEYGQKLIDDFKYEGSPPFENTYEDHLIYYRALLGIEVDAAVSHFEKKAQNVSTEEYGSVAIETLIEFLVRLGKQDKALEVCIDKLLGKLEPMGLAPSPFEIAQTERQRVRLMEFYRSQDDLLGFTASLLQDSSPQHELP
ncbi:MAG: hypothetical protein AAF939_17815 [Planctomycetota bacterium]